MNQKQMEERCGKENFKLKGRAKLKDYRFVYDGHSRTRQGAVANVVESKGDIVWGVLYEVNEICLCRLDYYEGYPKFYTRRQLEVEFDGKIYKAWIYLRDPLKPGKPSEKYRQVIIEGAKDCNLPEDYIERFLEA